MDNFSIALSGNKQPLPFSVIQLPIYAAGCAEGRMLKKLLNRPEQITYERLRALCLRREAEVYAKVRLADVLPIEGSGVNQEMYEFALQSHYDFVVTGRDQVPLLAVEFDGPQHNEPSQIARDTKKDELSRRFWLPLVRVRADDLNRTQSQLDRLTETIDQWFENRAQALATSAKTTDATCPLCGARMVERFGKYGRFLGCSKYPACAGTCDLPSPRKCGSRWKKLAITGLICAAVVALAIGLAFNWKSIGAWQGRGNQPADRATRSVAGPKSSMTLEQRQAFAATIEQSDYPACPNCGKRTALRRNSKTGEPFFGCSDFPQCRATLDVHYPK